MNEKPKTKVQVQKILGLSKAGLESVTNRLIRDAGMVPLLIPRGGRRTPALGYTAKMIEWMKNDIRGPGGKLRSELEANKKKKEANQ